MVASYVLVVLRTLTANECLWILTSFLVPEVYENQFILRCMTHKKTIVPKDYGFFFCTVIGKGYRPMPPIPPIPPMPPMAGAAEAA